MENAMELVTYLRAGYCCFWIQTVEAERAERTLIDLIQKTKLKDGSKITTGVWNCDIPDKKDPMKSLQSLVDFNGKLAVFFRNFHWFMKPPIIQKIQNNLEKFKAEKKAVVVISPEDKIPAELEKDFLLMEFKLPDEEQITGAVKFISESVKKPMPEGKKLKEIVTGAKSLTLTEVENICAKSFIDKGYIDPLIVSRYKKHAVEKSGLLTVLESDLTFDDIRGYDKVKRFTDATSDNPESKGFLLIGVPGCGKTLFLYCLAGHTRRPTLVLDSGRMFSKYVGETDRLIREAQQMITAFGECNVIIDEFEKQFAGASGGGDMDSGVTKRAAGSWLEFFQNRPYGVRIYGTCNSFVGIPPEYLRPGRWDSSPFFIDIPNEAEKEEILEYHAKKNDIKLMPNDQPDMTSWTGAEIEACCHIASMMKSSLVKASEFIVPQMRTMNEEISALRAWAKDRTIPASDIPINGDSEPARAIDI